MRSLVGLWRILRLVLHVLRGLVVVRGFERLHLGARHAGVQRWSRQLLDVLGIELIVQGEPGPGPRLLVANHVSWLDIAAVHAVMPEARFVSKADVQHWPLIGKLVDGAGTLYIERSSKRDALRVVHQAADALKAGDTVAFFPEGTTGPGPELLPFHGNLLQAAIATATPVQPLVLRWHEPGERFSTAARFIGDMTLVQSLWSVVCARGLAVQMTWLPQVPVAHEDQRRKLAEDLRGRIVAGLAR
ncbi:MAG: 1-acyl-sn-glycerol-3-phosphate acyltransferase [Paucibacter sp.]|nr:1-acyl-sn-glycerol-3-phosphate acyltransferase [Roseateles sp.]